MDEADWAEQIIRMETESMIANSKRALRQNNGSGHCMDCDDMIPLPRLKALPRCARCIDCQMSYEGEK